MKSIMADLRVCMVGVILLSCLSTGDAQQDDRPPPRYNSHKLPETRFTCEGKFTGRYYADPETDCQMFHICSKTSKRDVRDFRFLCPNGTVFDQEHQVCADYYQVVCHFDSDTNPLGPIFEIFKLSTKESASRREFGSVPHRDPDYLGQNSLNNEELQVEEYNNNKLASSRNSLPFEISQIKPKDDTLFQPTRTPQSTAIPLTEGVTTPQPISTRRTLFGKAPILFKSSTQRQQPTTTIPLNFSRRLVHTTSSPSQVNQLYDRLKQGRRTDAPPPVETSSPRPSTSTTYPPPIVTETTERPSSPASIFDEPQLQFNDFASLSKFQAQFHASFTNPPRTTQTPTTTTEQISTSTFSPIIEYTLDNFAFAQQYENTTPEPLTSRRIPQHRFSDSKSQEEESFTTTQANFPETSTANLDFNTRPRSETKPPTEFHSTRRIPFYESTYRTTYQDVTTSGPQTFKQQPTRFNDEFFRKVDKPIDFKTTDDEDDFFANAVPLTTTGNSVSEGDSIENNAMTEAVLFSTSTVRPLRRRRPKLLGQKDGFNDPRFKFSRRRQSAKYTNKTFSVIEKSAQEEIFNVEASINSGSAGINNFQNKEFAGDATERVKGDISVSSTTPNSRQRVFYGRRVRPSKEGRAHGDQGADVPIKPINRQRGKIRFRERPSSSTTERTEFVSATTYRPATRIRPTIMINLTTTTIEPELVTASDAEISRLRSRHQLSSTTRPIEEPIRLSLKVTSKSSFKPVPPPPKPTRESGEESRTRSPDYDYTYYDTDHDRGVDSIIKQDSFGEKFSNV